MNFKKIFSMLIITTFLFGGASAYAAESTPDSTTLPSTSEDKLPISLQYTGSVTEIIKDNEIVSALVITEGNDENTARRFNISDVTVIINNENGLAESLSAIKVGDKVSVIASPMSTFSIPPQSPAYIRLTELVPELLSMVDEKKIAFNPAVELSYLKSEEQLLLIDAMDTEQATPSLSQAQRIKKFSTEGNCTLEAMCAIMSEEKKGEPDKVTLAGDKIKKYFPKNYTPQQMEATIIKLLEGWHKKRTQEQER